MSNADIKSKCELLAGFYCGDVDPTDLYGECLQFVYYVEDEVKERQKKESSPNEKGRKKTLFETLYSRIKSNRLESSFPNIEIALRIFLSMMVEKGPAISILPRARQTLIRCCEQLNYRLTVDVEIQDHDNTMLNDSSNIVFRDLHQSDNYGATRRRKREPTATIQRSRNQPNFDVT
ncbi:hypothetical protein OUZ56_012030 [Daphnia magna]|uniref:Uncharacterized protein n=1 Tax=Daphnia magna TaxID=35525 RepID=A0ABQ9Z256_9CRUS|nr:hypothetical protein OUZ56_012030 [Daphnia magna]